MCLFLVETCLFIASPYAARLSICTVAGSQIIPLSGQGSLVSISQKSLCIQRACLAQLNSAIYFDSADEVGIIDCFRALQTIGVPLMVIAQLEIDFIVSLHPPQLASTEARRDWGNTGQERAYKKPTSTSPAT